MQRILLYNGTACECQIAQSLIACALINTRFLPVVAMAVVLNPDDVYDYGNISSKGDEIKDDTGPFSPTERKTQHYEVIRRTVSRMGLYGEVLKERV